MALSEHLVDLLNEPPPPGAVLPTEDVDAVNVALEALKGALDDVLKPIKAKVSTPPGRVTSMRPMSNRLYGNGPGLYYGRCYSVQVVGNDSRAGGFAAWVGLEAVGHGLVRLSAGYFRSSHPGGGPPRAEPAEDIWQDMEVVTAGGAAQQAMVLRLRDGLNSNIEAMLVSEIAALTRIRRG